MQSMCNTHTSDARATIDQIARLHDAGCEIIRLAVPDQAAADALPEIVHASPIPVVADIHFDYRLALAAAKAAAEKGIRIYTIGIGTPEGAPISIDGEFIKDEQGDMVVSKLDEQMLEQIALTTGGAYIRATNRSLGLDEIVQKINEVEKKELTSTVFEDFNEQYQYLIGLALALLLLEFAMLERRSRLLARFNIFRKR